MAKTRYQLHVDNWSGCTKCDLAKCRTRVVIGRGKIPADVVFIGEAPGKSEDVIGSAFVGPAGHLLDRIVSNALEPSVRTAYTNLVGCIPLGDDGDKVDEPAPASVKACRPRLVEFVRLCRPRMVVFVGTLSKRHVSGQSMFALPAEKGEPAWLGGKPMEFVELLHPAFILRANEASRGLLEQKMTVRLKTAAQTLFHVPY